MRVSTVIPAYNAAATISAAIVSLQEQTMPDWEAIVIDDASTDGTAEILREMSAQDSRIRVARNAVNLGPAGSRNVGLGMARGDWVALLDADDLFDRSRLATLLSLGEEEDADMVADNLLVCDEADASTRRLFESGAFSSVRFMRFQEFIESCYFGEGTPRRSGYVFMQPIIRRVFLERHAIRFEPRVRNGEDFLFYLDCFAAGARWLVTPDAMYSYRIRNGSLTEIVRNLDRTMTIRKLHALIRRPSIAEDKPLADALEGHRRLIAYTHYSYAFKHALTKGEFRNLLVAISIHPSAVLPSLRELRRRVPKIYRRWIRRFVPIRGTAQGAVTAASAQGAQGAIQKDELQTKEVYRTKEV